MQKNMPKYKCWSILENIAAEKFGIFKGHLVPFMAIWDILWTFWIFFACSTKKNLATLLQIPT
jgi:hypothetical protein